MQPKRVFLAKLKASVNRYIDESFGIPYGDGPYLRISRVGAINGKGWTWNKEYLSVEDDVISKKIRKLHELYKTRKIEFGPTTFMIPEGMLPETRIDFVRLLCATFPLHVWYMDETTQSYKWIRNDENLPESFMYEVRL